MKVKLLFLSLIVLLALAGCAGNSNDATGTTTATTTGSLQLNGDVKEYFIAGPDATSANSISQKVLFKESRATGNKEHDFETKDDIDGVRLYFSYSDGTTSEVVYKIGGRDYHALVDDIVYAGHDWIGLEIENLYGINEQPNPRNKQPDRIGLANIKTGEIIVVTNPAFSNCKDLESLEVLASNRAYFLCENSAYYLDLNTKNITTIASGKRDKFEDSQAIIFADGQGVYQAKSKKGQTQPIKLISSDAVVSGMTALPQKIFKNSGDEVLYFDDSKVVNKLSLTNNTLTPETVTVTGETIPATAMGPVRNEDGATAKFMNKQTFLDSNAFYTFYVQDKSIERLNWNNTDYELMKPFITNSHDAEEHIFFGEVGIAYVVTDRDSINIKYIKYEENASPKQVTFQQQTPTGTGIEIDDITLIGETLYFKIEQENGRQETKTYYKADVSKETIVAKEYTGNKSITKVIDIDLAITK